MGKLLDYNNVHLAEEIRNGIANGSFTYYMVASHPYEWPDENNPPDETSTVTDAAYDTFNSLLFGKKITTNDFRFMAPRHDWTSGSVYTNYSNLSVNTTPENPFYVITDENKVFKCLSNAKGAASTIKPTLTQNTAFQTSDDYVWKYMYTNSTLDMTNHATNGLIPVVPNTDVVTSAKASIDVIDVVSGGAGYITVHSGLIRAIQSTTLLQIEDTASLDNGFYNLSAFYVNSGPGAGSLTRITGYTSNATGNFVTLEDPLTSISAMLSSYQIAPYVRIIGDGTGAKAIATVSENDAILNITIAASGDGYTRAEVKLEANTFYGSGATATAYVAPPGGHGANPYTELGCTHFGLNTRFIGSESNTIVTETSFRRYGLLKNPLDANNVAYTGDTFNMVFKCTVTPAATFTKGVKVTGQTSKAVGTVLHSNSTVLFLTGDKNFALNETIVQASDSLSANIATIISSGDISRNSGQILYINNITEKPRSNASSEVIKLAIKV